MHIVEHVLYENRLLLCQHSSNREFDAIIVCSGGNVPISFYILVNYSFAGHDLI